jgi:hypothetical protein
VAFYWNGEDAMPMRKRKPEPDPDDSKKALTLAEIQAAHLLGLFVTTCGWCNQATFYGTKGEPKSCGRLTCGRALKEEWAK